jgi:hypothetical protein
MVDVVLDEQVRRTGIADQVERLPCPREEEAGNVERVDRLDQQPDPGARQLVCGETQVRNERLS